MKYYRDLVQGTTECDGSCGVVRTRKQHVPIPKKFLEDAEFGLSNLSVSLVPNGNPGCQETRKKS